MTASMHIKHNGKWTQTKRNDALVSNAVADNIYIKSTEWLPVFSLVALARWGYATYAGPNLTSNGHTGPSDFIDNLTSVLASNDDDVEFTYNLPDIDTYAYFAVPKSVGIVAFLDTVSGLTGSWDGATWLDDFTNMGDTGPTEVMYDGGNGLEPWYVYRTDWTGGNTGTGDITWSVSYPERP